MASSLACRRKLRRLPAVFGPEETARVLGAMREPGFQAGFSVICDMGLRISEAVQLKAEGSDRGRGVLHGLGGASQLPPSRDIARRKCGM